MGVNTPTFLTAIALLLIVIIIILFAIHKKLKKKVILKQEVKKREDLLREEIKKLKESKQSPSTILDSVDTFAKNLFKEIYHIEKNQDYSELIEIFKEKKKEKAISFSKEMILNLYSGNEIKKEGISLLLNTLNEIIDDEYPRPKPKPVKEIQPTVKKPEMPLSLMDIPDNIIKKKEWTDRDSQTKGALIKRNLYKPTVRIIKPFSISIIPSETKTLPQLKEQSFLEADKNAELLAQINEAQIRSAYKELQRKFEQAYQIAKKTNNLKNQQQLEEFQASITKAISEYSKDRFKIVELAQEISTGARLLRIIGDL